MKKIKIKVLDNGALKIKHSKDFQDVKEVANVLMAAGTVTIINSSLCSQEKAEFMAAIRLGFDTCFYLLNKEPEADLDAIKQMIDKLLNEIKTEID